MGNKLKFVYNVDECKVRVYSEEWDCYDGYDNLGTPYYWSLSDTWEEINLLEFAQLMEFYLEFKKQFDGMGIFCVFKILQVVIMVNGNFDSVSDEISAMVVYDIELSEEEYDELLEDGEAFEEFFDELMELY